MRVLVSAPSVDVTEAEIERIHSDLDKIDRRLAEFKEEVSAEVRISDVGRSTPGFHVVIELHYGRHHHIAKTEHADLGQAVREGREDLLRQINDNSRGGHSSIAKGR